MIRRLHVQSVHSGEIDLSQSESHHARDVLRLHVGDEVQLFDDKGLCGLATIVQIDPVVRVRAAEPVLLVEANTLVIASAIPKGERADWMIEKLSELGVSRFLPLLTDRSVVEPKGKNKLERWKRLAVESAKQSRRPGVMQIDEPIALREALSQIDGVVFALSTGSDARPIRELNAEEPITCLIGPEGGWSEGELKLFSERKIAGVKLTGTILRIETAAIVAAAMLRIGAHA